MFPSTILNPKYSQERWIERISRNYKPNFDHDPCVFRVPPRLRDTKPQAYAPQAVGLGPYHHFSAEVHKMESQKRSAIMKFLGLNHFDKSNTQYILFVNQLVPKMFNVEFGSASHLADDQEDRSGFESLMASFYDKYEDLDGGILAWVLVVDSIFLLNFLHSYRHDPQQREEGPVEEQATKDPEPCLEEIEPDLQRLVPDILMLENQIPFFLIWKIRTELQHASSAVEIDLFGKVVSFCMAHSPLRLSENPDVLYEAFRRHVLHFMYQSIVSNSKCEPGDEEEGHEQASAKHNEKGEGYSKFRTYAEPVLRVIRKMAEEANSAIELAKSSGIKIPGFVGQIAMILRQVGRKSRDLFGKEIVSAEKIDIPSALELKYIAKIGLEKAEYGIRHIGISNDVLCLPEICLGPNSEVILRNLVAYEAASAQPESTLELAEYLDLMCGIIHSEDDVRLLRDKGIIMGCLSNDEIIRLFNGFNRSMERLQEGSRVFEVVAEANYRYGKNAVVKVCRWTENLLALIEKVFPLMVLGSPFLAKILSKSWMRFPFVGLSSSKAG